MLSLRQPVTGTATGRRDKVQPVGDRPVPFSCGCAAMNRYRAGTWRKRTARPAHSLESGRLLTTIIHRPKRVKLGAKADRQEDEMNISEEEYGTVLRALKLAAEYFISRDQMNARIHCQETRLSPITELVRDALNMFSSGS